MKTSFGKKIASFILVATAAVCSIAMIGCDSKPGAFHKHKYEYTYNDDATCGQDGTETGKCKYCELTDTRVKKGTATGAHDYSGYFCTTCGEYAPNAPVTYGLEFTEYSNFCAVKGIGSATASEILIPSKYNGKPVEEISYWAFRDCGGVTKIIIPPSVKEIGMSAFSGCKKLREVVIPDTVTTIGSSAFEDCSALTSITLPKGIDIIDGSLFAGCSSLASIDIPNNITEIQSGAFHSCSSLRSVTIPSSVTTIGRSVFSYCENLISVTIPKSVTVMGDWLFYQCKKVSVFCEAPSMPAGWDSEWNYIGNQWTSSGYGEAYCPVTWGYKV